MGLLLRKVDNLNRMVRHVDSDWLTEADVPGVMVREFAPRNPTERGLSVWQIDGELENLEDVIAAIGLAAEKQKLAPIQYLTFPEEIVGSCGLQLQKTNGLTHYIEAAGYHREILGLTALNVGKLTHEACIQSGFQREKLTESGVLDRIVTVVSQNNSILQRVGRSSPLGEQILDRLDGN